jgi:DNA-binding response OmpR family regulator
MMHSTDLSHCDINSVTDPLANPSRVRKVLIVEDEESLAEILDYNLTKHGFEVCRAADGLEACRVIGRERPDLILLDILLPLLNGLEICRMVRDHEDTAIARTPIIMLSALASEKDRLKGTVLGADLYLPKPYNIKEVIASCRELLTQY